MPFFVGMALSAAGSFGPANQRFVETFAVSEKRYDLSARHQRDSLRVNRHEYVSFGEASRTGEKHTSSILP